MNNLEDFIEKENRGKSIIVQELGFVPIPAADFSKYPDIRREETLFGLEYGLHSYQSILINLGLLIVVVLSFLMYVITRLRRMRR